MTTKDEALRVASKESGFGFFGQWLLWQGDTNNLLAFARAMERELSGAQEVKAGEWLPIESAPKDGTPIIVARHMNEFGWVRGWAAWAGEGYIAGWVSRGFDDTLSNLGLAHPTHWQPLPPPPSATPAESTKGGQR